MQWFEAFQTLQQIKGRRVFIMEYDSQMINSSYCAHITPKAAETANDGMAPWVLPKPDLATFR